MSPRAAADVFILYKSKPKSKYKNLSSFRGTYKSGFAAVDRCHFSLNHNKYTYYTFCSLVLFVLEGL